MKREHKCMVPMEHMITVGQWGTKEFASCADSWSESELQLLRAKLPKEYHAVPTDHLRKSWVNLRKQHTPGFRVNGHGPTKKRIPSDELLEHYGSEWYRRLRDQVFERAKNRCQVCDGTATECHHRTYDNLNTSLELFDLIAVCRKCHRQCDKRRRVEAEESSLPLFG